MTDETLIGVSPRALHSELMCPICLDLMRNTQTTKEVRYSLTEYNDTNEYMSMSLFITYCISFCSVFTGFVRSVLLLHYVVGMYKCITLHVHVLTYVPYVRYMYMYMYLTYFTCVILTSLVCRSSNMPS